MVYRPFLAAFACTLSLLISSCQSPTTTTVFVQPPTATVREANVGAVTSSSGAPSDTLSWSHTIAEGQNRLLVVAVAKRSHTEMTSVTFGAQSLTRLVRNDGAGNTPRAELWYLINPPVGPGTIVAANNGIEYWNAFGIDFTGVNQATPFGTPATLVGTTATPSLDAVSSANDLVLDLLCYERGGLSTNPYSTGVGQFLKVQQSLSDGTWSGALSTEAGAASVTMSWNRTSEGIQWAQVAVGIKPAP